MMTLALIVLVWLPLYVLAGDSSHTMSVISWASHPVLPGQVLVLQGTFPASVCNVVFDPLDSSIAESLSFSVTPLQQTAISLKVKIPASEAVTAYNVSACGSDPIAINLPDVWWVLGDEGDTSSPGGWVRSYGRSISRADTKSDRQVEVQRREMLTAAAMRGDRNELRNLLMKEQQEQTQRTFQSPRARPDVAMILIGGAPRTTFRIVAEANDLLTPYSASFAIPHNMQPGVYETHFSNNFCANMTAPFDAFLNETTPRWTTITIRAKPQRQHNRLFPLSPSLLHRRCFNSSVNVLPPSTWRCADDALTAALTAASDAGGGTVVFPRGQFYLENRVTITSGVVVVGAAMDLTSIYFQAVQAAAWDPHNTTLSLFNCDHWIGGGSNLKAVVGGASTWGLANFTVYVPAWYPDIVYVSPFQRFTMDNVRVIANAFFAQNPPVYHPEKNCSNNFLVRSTRGREANYSSQDVGAVIRSHGRNVFVTNCDLFGTDVVITSAPPHNHGFPNTPTGMQFGLFENNTIRNGGASHQMPQWEMVAFRNNTCVGASLMSGGNMLGTSSSGAASKVFEGQNTVTEVWSNDRETLTYDDAGGAFWGYATVSGTTIRLPTEPLNSGVSQLRVLAMILNGTGAHEYRHVVVPGGVAGNDNRTWTIDRPFSSAVVDNSSVFLQILPARNKNLHVLNKLVDGGAIQLYGTAVEVIIGHNEATRMTGFFGWGQWRGWGSKVTAHARALFGERVGGSFGVGMNPNTHVQIVSNTVLEGNNIVNIWYTNTSGTTGDYNPGPWLHGTGVANFLDQNCFGVVDGHVGFLSPEDNPANQWANAFMILRDNVAKSNGGVWVGGASRDVLVENTVLENSDHTTVTVDNSTEAVLVV
eukprot:m.232207 g.232207  ORF g.232207 m.232207 type:complete len:872 (-) comp33616_c4_seq4:117-2732(-)